MRSAIKAVGLAAMLAVGGMAGPVAAAEEKPQPGDEKIVVARINGEPIHMQRMQRALQAYGKDLSQLSPMAYYKTVMDRLIDQELAARAGVADNLEVDPVVQANLAEARANVLAGAYLRKIAAAASTEPELRRRYEAMAKEGVKKVSARHILVTSEADALEVIAALKGGADFAELAKVRSVGPSAPNGGDLGTFGRTQMVKPFADAAFMLTKGAFSETPVKTQFGWHVIKVEDITSDPQPPFHEAHDALAEEVRTEAMMEMLETLRAKATIERFGPDGAPLEQ